MGRRLFHVPARVSPEPPADFASGGRVGPGDLRRGGVCGPCALARYRVGGGHRAGCNRLAARRRVCDGHWETAENPPPDRHDPGGGKSGQRRHGAGVVSGGCGRRNERFICTRPYAVRVRIRRAGGSGHRHRGGLAHAVGALRDGRRVYADRRDVAGAVHRLGVWGVGACLCGPGLCGGWAVPSSVVQRRGVPGYQIAGACGVGSPDLYLEWSHFYPDRPAVGRVTRFGAAGPVRPGAHCRGLGERDSYPGSASVGAVGRSHPAMVEREITCT